MKRTDIKTILVIGSSPIIIGQAAEFDYAGTQACLSLKEEGYRVILINSNPATIMTDAEIADKVYIEPISLEFVSQIIRKLHRLHDLRIHRLSLCFLFLYTYDTDHCLL